MWDGQWHSIWRGLLSAPSIAEPFLLFEAARSLPSERFDGSNNYPMSLLLVIKVARSHSRAALNTNATHLPLGARGAGSWIGAGPHICQLGHLDALGCSSRFGGLALTGASTIDGSLSDPKLASVARIFWIRG